MSSFIHRLGQFLSHGGAVLVVIVVGWMLVVRASKRFEREQMRRGEWDEYGPLVESDPPPTGGRGRMGWRLEVIGAWRSVRRWRDSPPVRGGRRIQHPEPPPEDR